MKRAAILLVDLSASNLVEMLSAQLRPYFDLQVLRVRTDFDYRTEVVETVSRDARDLICLGFRADQFDPVIALLNSPNEALNARPIIAAVDVQDPPEMLRLLQAGVVDFITPPFKPGDILPRIWRLVERTGSDEKLTATLKEKLGLGQIIGNSQAFAAEVRKIPSIARCDASVIITGETGTGKELCARAVHYLSPRSNKPFVPINCGAIPSELAENELFGHVKGAFTGASSSQFGLIREAEGGVLFLDEVDCLPLLTQVKLLRFLQDREYRPLGSTKTQSANVRVIAASNTDLEDAVQNGKLRQDLYYRLHVISLNLPAVRHRQEDIPLLADYFLRKYARELDRPAVRFSLGAMQKMLTHAWPGNVRELEHVVQRAVALSDNCVIRDRDLVLSNKQPAGAPESFRSAKARAVAQFEKRYIAGVLTLHGGNITRAAKASQKNRRAFWQLIRKHKIDVPSFKQSNDCSR